MSIATQHIMRIAAVLALTVASTTVMAQERRGDDGPRMEERRGDDGPRMEERGDHRGPPGWARVRVEEARYGTRRGTCDARRSVRNEIERNRGAILVGNQLCGDPARGEPKRLSVTYRCGNSESVRITARENETLRLSCRR